METVRIFDTTLRDGEQSPGATLTRPEKVEIARQMRRRYPPDPAGARGPHAVLRTGRAELIREVTEEMTTRGARDEEHLRFMRDLGLRSVLMVPMVPFDIGQWMLVYSLTSIN